MIRPWLSACAQRRIILRCAAVLFAIIAAPLLPAQTGPAITIRILDGKTGAPIAPSNLLIRVDHKDEFQNEGLKLNGVDPATITLPAGVTQLSVQGTYDESTEIYVNCDSDTGRGGGELKWYSIQEILKTGMITADMCYKGRYAPKMHVVVKPGEFVFFVRTPGLRDELTK